MLKEYDSEQSKKKKSMETVSGTPICPEITIHNNFDWHGADGLYVAIRYGSRHYQLEVWVPKPEESILESEDDWSFQLPGKNINDTENGTLVGCGYEFADLNVSSVMTASGFSDLGILRKNVKIP